MSTSRVILRHVLCGALLGSVCLFAPLEAEAACSGSDISAKWQVYFKAAGGPEPFWLKCKVKVDSGVVRTGTACTARFAISGVATGSTTGGNLSVASNCAVTGKIQVNGCNFVLQGATMSKDGQKIAGVGSDCSGSSGEVFQMTAVKR